MPPSAKAISPSGSMPASIPVETMAEWWMEGALEKLADLRRSSCPGPPPRLHIPRRAQHEPRRVAPRPSSHQRGRGEPQSRMARALVRKEPRSDVRPQCDGLNSARLRGDVPATKPFQANFLAGFEAFRLSPSAVPPFPTVQRDPRAVFRPISRPARAMRPPSPAKPTCRCLRPNSPSAMAACR